MRNQWGCGVLVFCAVLVLCAVLAYVALALVVFAMDAGSAQTEGGMMLLDWELISTQRTDGDKAIVTFTVEPCPAEEDARALMDDELTAAAQRAENYLNSYVHIPKEIQDT